MAFLNPGQHVVALTVTITALLLTFACFGALRARYVAPWFALELAAIFGLDQPSAAVAVTFLMCCVLAIAAMPRRCPFCHAQVPATAPACQKCTRFMPPAARFRPRL